MARKGWEMDVAIKMVEAVCVVFLWLSGLMYLVGNDVWQEETTQEITSGTWTVQTWSVQTGSL